MRTQPLFRFHVLAAPLGAALLFSGLATAAGDTDLLRCRAIGEAMARLACYDALQAAPAGAPVPAAVAPAAPAPATTPVPAAAAFGFEMRAIQAAPGAIESSISGLFEGWKAGTRIRLDNGQVWQVVDDSRAIIDQQNPKVRVSRAAMGSFFFEVEGRTTVARVRRVE